MAVGIRLFTVEAGRKHACIVHDQGISRVKLVNDVVSGCQSFPWLQDQ